MVNLSVEECVKASDAFLMAIYGKDVYYRWTGMKVQKNFILERDFVTWLLDCIEAVERNEPTECVNDDNVLGLHKGELNEPSNEIPSMAMTITNPYTLCESNDKHSNASMHCHQNQQHIGGTTGWEGDSTIRAPSYNAAGVSAGHVNERGVLAAPGSVVYEPVSSDVCGEHVLSAFMNNPVEVMPCATGVTVSNSYTSVDQQDLPLHSSSAQSGMPVTEHDIGMRDVEHMLEGGGEQEQTLDHGGFGNANGEYYSNPIDNDLQQQHGNSISTSPAGEEGEVMDGWSYEAGADTSCNDPASSFPKIKYKYPCPTCGKLFAQRQYLKQHIQCVHDHAPTHPCTYCGRTYITTAHLALHVKSIHLMERHKCPVCCKEFTQQANMKAHVESVHNKARPFACDQCDKTFPTNSTLVTHRRSKHEGRVRYTCDLCSKGYYVLAEFRRHKEGHERAELRANKIRCKLEAKQKAAAQKGRKRGRKSKREASTTDEESGRESERVAEADVDEGVSADTWRVEEAATENTDNASYNERMQSPHDTNKVSPPPDAEFATAS